MRFILKAMALLALIVGGKISKSHQSTALASRYKRLSATEVVLVDHRPATPPTADNSRQPEVSRSQVLSVFFK